MKKPSLKDLLDLAGKDAPGQAQQAKAWFTVLLDMTKETSTEEIRKRCRDLFMSESRCTELVLDLMAMAVLHMILQESLGAKQLQIDVNAKEKNERIMGLCRDIAVARTAFCWVDKNEKGSK